MELKITDLIIYPVKSLRGISLESVRVERRGLEHDRRWMIVDENGRFISQRTHPVMALLRPSIANKTMKITHSEGALSPLQFSIEEPEGESFDVTVWDDTCPAKEVSKEASDWFTKALGMPCKLVYMPDDSLRPTDPDFSITGDDHVSFADGYPLLLISQASLDYLNQKLENPVPMNRFRPNVVISGGHPHVEDELRQFIASGLTFHGVKPCSRCVLTTIDQESGTKGSEPLKTLNQYRKKDHKILFGQNLIPEREGELVVGATFAVNEWQTAAIPAEASV